MPLRDESKYKIQVEGEPSEVTEIRNKILETFDELEFVDEGHKYYLHGEELSSVSAFASRFEEEFDTVAKATAYAKKNGETPEYWIDKWKFNNLRATITGTQVHAFAESCAWLRMGHPENITPDNKYKYIADKNWLIPTRHKEEAVLKFWDEFPYDCMHIVLPETRVYTSSEASKYKYTQNYAGTFDLLMYYKHPTDDSKSGLVVGDWKTNADLYKEYARTHNKMMYYPFSDFYMEDFGGYTVQLNAYQVPLEDIGLKVIGRRIIWLKDDGTYEIVPVDNVTNKIRNIIR